MARRGFGGSGDYSSFFGSLYSQNSAARRARQDADDQDAMDRWENGLMTDEDWLAYIAGRVSAESDPKRKQKWVTAQRKYTSVIADKQAEYAYESGGSINDLIGHYQSRMAAMQVNSNEYRELQLRVNGLLDQRSAEKIQEDSEKLLLEIEKGTKTYADLRTYLKTAHEQSRPNSDLRKQIDGQLDRVNETIRTNKLEGAFEKLQYRYDAGSLSGRGYAKALRQMAVQFKDNDPKRYYQILQAAVALEKQGGRGGGGGGGYGSGGGSSSTKKLNASIDGLQAKRNDLLTAIEAYENGARTYVDRTGATIALTAGYIKKVDHDLMDVWDRMTAAYTAKGDKSAARNTAKTKADYVSRKVTLHNTMEKDVASRHLMTATTSQIEAALRDPDPVRAKQALKGVAAQWKAFAAGMTNVVSPYGDGVGAELGPMESVDTDFVTRSATIAQALETLTMDGIDDASAAAAIESIGVLQGAGGGQYAGGQQDSYLSSLLVGVLEVSAREQGMQEGTLDRVSTGDGWAWVKKAPVSYMVPDPNNPSNMIMTTQMVTTGQTTDGRDLDIDGKQRRLVDVIVDINGRPTKVQAVAELAEAAGFNVLQAARNISLPNGVKIPAGTRLNEKQLAMVDKELGLESLIAAGQVETVSGLQTWQVVVPSRTDRGGREIGPEIWTQDAETGLWYKGALPIRGIQRDGKYGTVLIGEDGQLKFDWQSYASAQGVPAPYAGSDPKGAQALADMGAIDVSGIRGRDLLGNLTAEPIGLQSAYWDPMDDVRANMAGASKDDDSWWNPDQRRRRSESLRELDVKQQREFQAMKDRAERMNEDLTVDEFKSIKNLGAGLGINLDGTRERQRLDFMKNAKKDDVAIPSAKGGGKGPVVTLKSGVASGPDLKGAELDLPIPSRTGPNLDFMKDAKKDDVFVPKVKPEPKKKAGGPSVKPKPKPAKSDISIAKETKLQTGDKYIRL